MRSILILLNKTQVDYVDNKSIPLSLSLRTDKFLEIVGADGSQVDNVLRSLTLPDTPRNSAALMSFIAQSGFARGGTRVDVQVIVSGITLFNGPGVLKKSNKRSLSGPSFYLELLGDGLGLWERLDSVNLPDLQLGSLHWALGDLIDNWADSTFDNFPGYWCPVVYGNLKGDGYQWLKEMRPSVPFWRIVKAMFEGQGYTVNSEFAETLFFKRHAYLFGVGDKWKIASGEYELFRFRGSFGEQVAHVSGSIIDGLVYDSIENPVGMYSNNGQPALAGTPFFINPAYENHITIQSDGIYRFKMTVNAAYTIVVQVLVYRASVVVPSLSHNYIIQDSGVGDVGETAEFEELLEFNDEIRIKFQTVPPIILPSGELARIRSVRLSINLTPKPFLGCDISVSSCLHDRPVKDFLRGISHDFCLVWRVNDTTKQVSFGPRFDYTLIEGGEPITRRGFYRTDMPVIQGELDAAEVQIEYVSPFGDSLRMGYKDSSSDPMEEATLAILARDADKKTAPYYADIELYDRGVAGESSFNPFFTTLYQSQPSGIKLREDAYLPTVLPSSYNRGDRLPGIHWMDSDGNAKIERPPTWESDPKMGIMFPLALLFEFYYDEAASATYYSPDVRAPWITQHKWVDVGGTDALADYDFAPCYSDLPALDSDRVIRGLISTFYPNYISIIKEGQVLTGQMNAPLPTVAALTFRRLWRLAYDANVSNWLLLELTGYRALIGDGCSGSFIKYVPPRQIDMDGVTYDALTIEPLVPDILPETE